MAVYPTILAYIYAMRIVACGLAAAMLFADVAAAREESMTGYYGNTLVVFIPNAVEKRTWYNEGGTAVHFNAAWTKGQITLEAYDETWLKNDGYVPRVVPKSAEGIEGVAFMLHNHFPGQTWRGLVPDGSHQDIREIYAIVPGHQ